MRENTDQKNFKSGHFWCMSGNIWDLPVFLKSLTRSFCKSSLLFGPDATFFLLIQWEQATQNWMYITRYNILNSDLAHFLIWKLYEDIFWIYCHQLHRCNPAGSYMSKVKSRNTRIMCKICLKLTIKTPEWRQKKPGLLIVNFEHISHLVLVFLLLSLSWYLFKTWIIKRKWLKSKKNQWKIIDKAEYK